jgi:hypothetical protein
MTTIDPSHVEIRYIQGEYQFGRAILYGQLHSLIEDKIIIQRASIAQILQFAKEKKLVITNAQDVLKTVVLDNGFAA